MATDSATTKSTGGGGYTFADKVAAAFLAQMLKRAFPLEIGFDPIVGLHFETRESGHILDDLLLILQRGTEATRCAVSVKSNRQLTNTGFNQEFVADAWEQHRRPAGPNFNPEKDLLGLTVGVIQDTTFHEWRELLKQLTSTTLERNRVRFLVSKRRKISVRSSTPSGLRTCPNSTWPSTPAFARAVSTV
jgi:hypothetical protein